MTSAIGWKCWWAPTDAGTRLDALANYGLATDVNTLRRLVRVRRIATLAVTDQTLLTTAIDDAVVVCAMLMAEKLIRPAERASDTRRLRLWSDLAEASTTLMSWCHL